MRWRSILERTYLKAGFSSRAASILALHTDIQNLEDLQARAWESGRRRGLGAILADAPNCGPSVIAEIKAFREFGDPRRSRQMVSSPITVWLEPLQLSVLDAWIATQDGHLSRHGALRILMRDVLAHDCSPAEDTPWRNANDEPWTTAKRSPRVRTRNRRNSASP